MATGLDVHHAAISWTPTGYGVDFDHYEIQRRDDLTDWEPIAHITDEVVSAFDDYEGRRDVVSTYRMRVVLTYGAASAWSVTDTAEPPALDCSAVSFVSNEDPALNVEYEDQAPRAYEFPEHVEWRELYGRDLAVAFRELEDRGDELTFQLMAGTTTIPLTEQPGRRAFDPMLAIARAPLSYVCVLDGDGNRWFSSVRTPSGAWRAVQQASGTPARFHTMPIAAREVTRQPSTPDVVETTIVLWGAEGTFTVAQDRETTTTGHSFAVQPVDGWAPDLGAGAYLGAVAPNGRIVVGTIPYTNRPLRQTAVTQSFVELDPVTKRARNVDLPTTLDETSVTNFGQPVGGADLSDFVLVSTASGDRLMGVSFADAADSDQDDVGRFRAIVFLEQQVDGRWALDETLSRTVDDLKSDAAHPEAYEDATNSFAQTYAANPGMCELALLPQSGHVAVTHYFPRAGHRSASVAVLDPTVTPVQQVAWLELADFERVDSTDLVYACRSVKADPSSAVNDERFVVMPDVFLDSDDSNAEKAIIEFSYNASTATITQLTSPFLPFQADGHYLEAEYDDDGTLWLPVAVFTTTDTSLNALRTLGLQAWKKTAGARAFVAAAPAGGVWGLRPLPDVVYGSMAQTVAAPFAMDIDPTTGMIVTAGLFGKLCAIEPTLPPAQGVEKLTNPDFVANITDWTAFLASCTRVWDAGAGGRCKCTSSVNGVSGVHTGAYAIPAGAGGLVLQAGFDTANARHAKIQAEWLDAGGASVSSPSSTTYPIAAADSDTRVLGAFAVPAGATQVKLAAVLTDATNGEIFYVNWGSMRFDVATPHDPVNLDLAGIPVNGGHLLRHIGIDAPGRLWLSIQGYEQGETCPVWPCDPYRIHQFLVSVKLADL